MWILFFNFNKTENILMLFLIQTTLAPDEMALSHYKYYVKAFLSYNFWLNLLINIIKSVASANSQNYSVFDNSS